MSLQSPLVSRSAAARWTSFVCRYNSPQRLLYLGSDNKEIHQVIFKNSWGRRRGNWESSCFINTCRLLLQCPSVRDHKTAILFKQEILAWCVPGYAVHITVSASLNFLPLQRSWNQNSSCICNIILQSCIQHRFVSVSATDQVIFDKQWILQHIFLISQAIWKSNPVI